MSQTPKKPTGPDLAEGIAITEIVNGALVQGHVGGEPVLLARHGEEVFAVGATCTHYHGPLGEGIIVGDTVRCPWHHACFSLRTGEAVRAPAFDPIPRWRVDRQGASIYVREKLPAAPKAAPVQSTKSGWPSSVVIVGGGAAGFAAAEMLRREGYDRAIAMLSADSDPPCDRPNLSKDYLAGTAKEAWIPLKSPKFYAKREIALRLDTRVMGIDPHNRRLSFGDGQELEYGALLLATGADPVRLEVPGIERAPVHYLRTLADSRNIIAAAINAKYALVVGASFIGLEVAASLRRRGLRSMSSRLKRDRSNALWGLRLVTLSARCMRNMVSSSIWGETVAAFDGPTVRLQRRRNLSTGLHCHWSGSAASDALAEPPA